MSSEAGAFSVRLAETEVERCERTLEMLPFYADKNPKRVYDTWKRIFVLDWSRARYRADRFVPMEADL